MFLKIAIPSAIAIVAGTLGVVAGRTIFASADTKAAKAAVKADVKKRAAA